MTVENKGHLVAFMTIFMWSTTFVSTKVILEVLSPIEILLFRFLLGFFALLVIHPKFKLFTDKKDEFLFMILGGSGVFLYFILENIALQYTQATNVGIIVSAAPIFTAILAAFLLKTVKINASLILGFFVAISGIIILVKGCNESITINISGDLIALAGSLSFGVYSVLLQKIDPTKYHYIFVTQKTFFYGILWMVLYTVIFDEPLDYTTLLESKVLLNLLFLGLIASGLCFVLWNYAIRLIGSVSTSNYIYLVPLITALSSILILDEHITWSIFFGGILIILGLLISQGKVSYLVKIRQIDVESRKPGH
jgi:drug/metabolite transporter (DMT)-like permease